MQSAASPLDVAESGSEELKLTNQELMRAALERVRGWAYLMAWARSTHFQVSTGSPFSCRTKSPCRRPDWWAGPPTHKCSQWGHTELYDVTDDLTDSYSYCTS